MLQLKILTINFCDFHVLKDDFLGFAPGETDELKLAMSLRELEGLQNPTPTSPWCSLVILLRAHQDKTFSEQGMDGDF